MSREVEALFTRYLDDLHQQALAKSWRLEVDFDPAVANEVKDLPPRQQIEFLQALVDRTPPFYNRHREQQSGISRLLQAFSTPTSNDRSLQWSEIRMVGRLASELLRHNLPFTGDDVAFLLLAYKRHIKILHHYLSAATLIRAAEAATRSPQIDHAMQTLKAGLQDILRNSNTRENRQLIDRVSSYLDQDRQPRLNAVGPWSAAVLGEIQHFAEADRARWQAVLWHCRQMQSSRPSRTWRRLGSKLLKEIEPEVLRSCITRWLDPAVTSLSSGSDSPMEDQDADFAKGFVWLLPGLDDPQFCRLVADCGLACLRKIRNVGPVSARVGFACVNVLSEMPGLAPVSQLSRMRVKVKYRVALKLIEKALNAAAERSGLSRDDLEDMAVPAYGLGPDGMRVESLGSFEATLGLSAPHFDSVELTWKSAEGKPLKSPPAEVKRNHAAKLKDLKRTAADLQKMLLAQRLRVEQFFVNERRIGYQHWRKNLLDHVLMGQISRRLIWIFCTGDRRETGAWLNGELVNWASQPISGLNEQTIVQLWHPLASDTQTILSWRCWLEDNQIVQPFKQAHREVYILTPAEEQTETYSNRFAAHIIRQHQFASLCRERGWQYRLMGSGFDGGNTPTLELPRRDLKVEFWVDLPEGDSGNDPEHSIDQASGSGINLYLLTDQVRFYLRGQQVPLARIPAVVFSEIMRDVDLFVGVTSIGNDPTWADRGNNRFGEYWQSFAFGELTQGGELRRDILQRLLPQLKIGPRCKLDGKFLVVQGDLNTYKIHLGSGNVLMEPGNRYLCIVPDRGSGSGNVYLPFDGDNTLAIILSKAMLLAADTKITDQTILRQINPLKRPAAT